MAKTIKKIDEEQMARMQAGRLQGVAVRAYLAALSGEQPVQRGPSKETKLKALDDKIKTANPLEKVKLLQQRYNLMHGINESVVDLGSLEQQFLAVVKPYSERSGIVKDVWIEAGVPADVLEKADL